MGPWLIKFTLLIIACGLLLWAIRRLYWLRRRKAFQRQQQHARALGLPRMGITCAQCRRKFKFIQSTRDWRLGSRALGGVECCYCGNFYCQACVSRKVRGGRFGKRFVCACGRSRACIGKEGNIEMDNFKELVVFPA
jgi:hypothetical protein